MDQGGFEGRAGSEEAEKRKYTSKKWRNENGRRCRGEAEEMKSRKSFFYT